MYVCTYKRESKNYYYDTHGKYDLRQRWTLGWNGAAQRPVVDFCENGYEQEYYILTSHCIEASSLLLKYPSIMQQYFKI
jgi:hypothetical protein